ncbi:MAG: sigma-70 family RNA polymerase sigma factor [Planctomycetes bacterium]|nr:sigma-70 family RNA polymerase sigma factor [Planctomycetota bacterium]
MEQEAPRGGDSEELSPDQDALVHDLQSTSEDGQKRVFEFLYGELRRLARRYMSRERVGHTLQPTELVNEACLRLISGTKLEDITERRLMGYGARAMRQVLTDHARRSNARKRGGDWGRVTLRGVAESANGNDQVSLESLDLALERLEAEDPHLAELTELHYFGGMTGEQLAAQVGKSRATVNRELGLARALLLREIDRIEADRA